MCEELAAPAIAKRARRFRIHPVLTFVLMESAVTRIQIEVWLQTFTKALLFGHEKECFGLPWNGETSRK